jgi:hypothetical protein
MSNQLITLGLVSISGTSTVDDRRYGARDEPQRTKVSDSRQWTFLSECEKNSVYRLFAPLPGWACAGLQEAGAQWNFAPRSACQSTCYPVA